MIGRKNRWDSETTSKRPGISMEKISILRVMKKKKWTHPRFLHRGPKKAVEQDSDVHFDLTWAKKKETGFSAKNSYFS